VVEASFRLEVLVSWGQQTREGHPGRRCPVLPIYWEGTSLHSDEVFARGKKAYSPSSSDLEVGSMLLQYG
jgi:hypothetical protein